MGMRTAAAQGRTRYVCKAGGGAQSGVVLPEALGSPRKEFLPSSRWMFSQWGSNAAEKPRVLGEPGRGDGVTPSSQGHCSRARLPVLPLKSWVIWGG